MEGPPMITIDVYDEAQAPTAEAWIAQSTNWILVDKPQEHVQVDGIDGVLFYWDGLYAGKSAVVLHHNRAYVFSVNWLTTEDRLLADYEQLLSSVKWL